MTTKITPLLEAFDWEQLERVIVLSPHLDDAALSCGGLLHALRGRVPLLVITICCGDPIAREPQGLQPLTPLRGRQRRGFATPLERRREDISAMQSLGADYVHLGFADAVYRRSALTGNLIYELPRERWVSPNVDDSSYIEELRLLLRRMCIGMGRILVLSPLGIGHHVDHVITAQLALRLATRVKVLFYEDFPYVVAPLGDGNGDPRAAMARLSQEPAGCLAVPVEVDAKANLIRRYVTQVPALFGESAKIQEALTQRTHQGVPSEFYWRLRAIDSKPTPETPAERSDG